MPFFITVIGASAGGQEAICKLIASLPRDVNAAFFIVMHISRHGLESILVNRLQKCTTLHCASAVDAQAIEPGHIYIAPADHHLIVTAGAMHLRKGPSENRWRPSIDVLFRSAAVHYSERAIGIVLTGLLDDGTSCMKAIKKCGGTCMVQNPAEAAYPDMPQSVLDNSVVDHILGVTAMGQAIQKTIAEKKLTGVEVPYELKAETRLMENSITNIDEISKLGNHSVYTCPDCGGGLWEIKEADQTRYRCHIGHAFSQNDLLKKQFEALNGTLWVALRMMEERKNLLVKITRQDESRNMHTLAEMHADQARELETHINNLKELLFNIAPEN
ncbi:chemotaxis protein CheB [Niastella sp. OAS944]|uniref:chemotaxis protein CheB n=1 Tax=Niastella sp. OAS944 TaxID=2664089 RepID=UPI003499E89A|nr:two-component system chemotaxis response regulator CheB [Chitinophagaceae bacterium OAS944]